APAQAPAYLPPAQAPAAAAPAAPANGNGAATNGNGCDACAEEKKEEEAPPAPKYLLECLLSDTCFAKKGYKLYGWMEQSYTPSSASHRNNPVALNDIANEYLLNQVWIGGAKEVDTSKKEFQLGGRIDFFYGSDARYTIPRGLFDYQLRTPDRNLYDIYQFYVDAFLPGVGPQGTTVRMGRFATHCSYEVVQGPDTPFVSRSYGFMFNPFTHTGVYAITPLDDDWTISNGVAVGSDNFIDPTNRANYIGQIKYAPKDGPTQVLFNTVITDPQYNVQEAFTQYNVYNLQVIHKATDKLTYILDSTYSHTYDVPGIGFANWYGAVNYFVYNLSDNLSSTSRFELFDDPQGFRTGSKGLYTAVTTGLAWKPVDWLMFRPGVRYDINDRSRAFEGDYDLFTAFTDMIIRW
ncbi:MAG TPA: outer membrane beta-barrel protein, partial [Fimbriiglobus sp.]|nr:outer membrane beta-barrel protein [Fimbriiglobus sp.]